MLSRTHLKYLLLIVMSVVLSNTVILGAIPMRVAWRSFGRAWFWLGHLAVAGAFCASGMVGFGIVFLGLTALVGVYSEVEEHGSSVFNAGAIAILAALGSTAVAVGAWLYKTKVSLLAELKAQIAPNVEMMGTMNPNMKTSVDSIIQFLPSGTIIVMMVTLAVALVWERRFLTWLKLPQDGVVLSDRLREFRLPDLTVWIVMVAILGGFLQHGHTWLQVASLNALYVFSALYFFQGLAVVASAFQAFKVAPFWQAIWYVLIVTQLFFLVSFVGFADYWLEFRERLSRKPAETNKGF